MPHRKQSNSGHFKKGEDPRRIPTSFEWEKKENNLKKYVRPDLEDKIAPASMPILQASLAKMQNPPNIGVL